MTKLYGLFKHIYGLVLSVFEQIVDLVKEIYWKGFYANLYLSL